METEDVDKLKFEFSKGIVLWNENKAIVEKLNSIENLPEDLMNQNQLFSTYCDLRIQQNQLFLNSVVEDTEIYLPEIERISNEINEILDSNSSI